MVFNFPGLLVFVFFSISQLSSREGEGVLFRTWELLGISKLPHGSWVLRWGTDLK